MRRPFSRKEYRLECGSCQDPCALEFQPETTPAPPTTPMPPAAADTRMSLKDMSTEDLKKLLLDSFFDEIINDKRITPSD